MHHNYTESYCAPFVEVVEVASQQGFAASGDPLGLDVTPSFYGSETDWVL